MSEAKLGLVIVLTFAAAAIFGSLIMYANEGSETGANGFTGHAIAPQINDEIAGNSSLSVYNYSSYAVDYRGNAVLSSTAESTLGCTWSDWKDRDNADGTGDWETKADFSDVCAAPAAIDCKTTSGVDFRDAGQNVTCNTTLGAICRASDNTALCQDYKVRFCCGVVSNSTNKTPPAAPISEAYCFDSDGGLNYAKKGAVNSSNYGIPKTDYCIQSINSSNASTLAEYYCNNATSTVKYYNCPTGTVCSDGACVQTKVESSYFTKTAFINSGSSTDFMGKTVTLKSLSTTSALVYVDGVASAISKGQTKLVNGIKITITEIHTRSTCSTNLLGKKCTTTPYAASMKLETETLV